MSAKVPEGVAEELERRVRRDGYASVSELLRDLIYAYLGYERSLWERVRRLERIVADHEKKLLELKERAQHGGVVEELKARVEELEGKYEQLAEEVGRMEIDLALILKRLERLESREPEKA